MEYGYGGPGWIGTVITLVILAVLIIGSLPMVIWIVKRLSNNSSGQVLNKAAQSAVEIAKERYAKGEITREELHKLIEDLGTR